MRIRSVFPLIMVVAGCAPPRDSVPVTTSRPAPDPNCTRIETRASNLPDVQAAFPGQTRACAVTSNVAYDVAVLASGLVHPWAVEPLPDGSLLVTERPGRLRIVSATGALGAPLAGLPAVDARGQGGLLDVALSPDFASDRTIFWSYTEPRQGGNGTSVARGTLSADRNSVENVRVIFRALPTYDNTMHFGSRLAFDRDGKLYITTGERSDPQTRQYAQRLDSHLGKILRINADGTVPSDNPFRGVANAQPEIWSLGHRNVQAATFDSQGRFWVVEHGPRGGDELNLIAKGRNYGWPLQTYGEEYSGAAIEGASATVPQFEQPQYYWDPVIAPSGALYYTGSAFPAWRNSLFVGGMKDKRLVRLVLNGNFVSGEEHLLIERGQRVRDVRQGLNGELFIVTDEDNGQLWKITPR